MQTRAGHSLQARGLIRPIGAPAPRPPSRRYVAAANPSTEKPLLRKTISVFARDYDGNRLVRDEVVPGAEWVLAGEGVATVKWDGTPVLLSKGGNYKRYEVKAGKEPPAYFIPAGETDETTGKRVGWVPITDGPEDKHFREGIENYLKQSSLAMQIDGTFELVGPKTQGNPHGFDEQTLVKHGADLLPEVPRDFDGIFCYLATRCDLEGIVFWRDPNDANCEKAKVKRKDFGLPWPPKP